MFRKTKLLVALLLIFVPIQNIYNQNRPLELNTRKLDAFHLKLKLDDIQLLRSDLLPKLKLKDLNFTYNNKFEDTESYSYFYQTLYGILPSEKIEIDNNIVFALQSTLHKEDEAINMIRQYLGLSRDVFAIILAIIHLVKYH